MFVHRRASRPQRSVLTDDVLADLELAWEAEILNVALRLGRVQAEQGVVASPSIERYLRECLTGISAPSGPGSFPTIQPLMIS